MSNLRLTYFSSGFVVLLCVLVLLGWQIDMSVLRSIIPNAPQTTPLTVVFALTLAIALAVLGKSVHNLQIHENFRWRWVYQLLAGFAVLLACWTGIQYIFHLPSSTEFILFPELVKEHSDVFPGRPSPRTLFTVIFIGCSIFLAYPSKQTTKHIAYWLAIITFIFPWIALFGYTTTTKELYLIPDAPAIGMSPITAIMFIFLVIGTLNLWPDEGVMPLLKADSAVGTIVKILLPFVLIGPLLFSWLFTYLHDIGYLDISFGLAVNWGGTTLLIAGMVIYGGALIHKKDLEKEKLHESLEKAERRLRTIIEAAPDAIVIVNGTGKIILVNKQTQALFGYSRDELTGQQVEILMPEQYAKVHELHRASYVQSPKSRMMGEGKELRGKRKDGTAFPLEISLSPIETEDEILIFTAIRDITERIRKEEERRQYLKNLELAQHVARMGYYETDVQKGLCLASDNFCQLFGLKTNVFPMAEFEQLVHPDDHDWVMKKYAQSMQEKKSFQAEYRLINPENCEIIYVKSNSYFTYKDDNSINKILGINQDITQQKKNEAEILELNQTLEQKVEERTAELEIIRRNLERIVEHRTEQLSVSNQELEAFSYSVSHDLRAPLRAITGYSSILLEDYNPQLDEEGKRIIGVIIKNTNRMGQLIDDILGFSRVSRAELSHNSISMKPLFQEVYQNLISLENGSRDIEFNVDDIPSAEGDRGMITQAVTNLVSNAIKYTRPKEKTLINVGYKEGQKAYYIEDNGVGFDERHKSKLFEVFQRLHKENEFEGTGVGLAIVKRVIHKHGGKVWAESTINKGATFYFTLS